MPEVKVFEKKHFLNSEKYDAFIRILKKELVPAMGCTEPISLAYAAAKARDVLGRIPNKIDVEVSGNIIKNVKSVVVPNTNGLKGIKAAVAAGVMVGDSSKALEVLAFVKEKEKPLIKKYLESCEITVKPAESKLNFDIILTLYKDNSYSKIRLIDDHTNIVLIEKDKKELFKISTKNGFCTEDADKDLLSIKDIVDFANTVDLNDIADVISRQIDYNSKICEEGLTNDYGASIGKVLLSSYGSDIKVRAKAKAAAGSDARMNGCELPVIIVSGSGNQGITASVPIIEYAKEINASEEMLYRAIILSDLIAIYQKFGIGSLSAFCGAVCAGCASGAGIAYMLSKGKKEAIESTIINALGIISGVVCDGAKASCAGKIAASIDAAILGYNMYLHGKRFFNGDGIVAKNADETIKNIWRLGKYGMFQTDKEILTIMVNCSEAH